MADPVVGVYGGVDTHKDVHVSAVCDHAGRLLGAESFAAGPGGYRGLEAWMRSFGPVVKVGVEGTSSYGVGLARHLAGAGIEVVEVIRPNRQMRRRRGKSDTVDAEAAARAALSGDAATAPKGNDGTVESIRALRVALCSTRSHRTRVANQIGDLVTTAPDALRAGLEPLTAAERVRRCARFRPGELTEPVEATKAALRTLARQHRVLDADLAELRRHLDELTAAANPALRAAKGIGPDTASILLIAAGDNPQRLRSEASFAALCGASPVEASSGKITRHRLNTGGNRQANHALWRIAMVRLSTDADTRAYAQRRQTDGKTRRETIRCLKRYIAREVYRRRSPTPTPAPTPPATCDNSANTPEPPSNTPPTASTPGPAPSPESNKARHPTTASCPPTAPGSTPSNPPLDLTTIGASSVKHFHE